jgi:hypothetical protein
VYAGRCRRSASFGNDSLGIGLQRGQFQHQHHRQPLAVGLADRPRAHGPHGGLAQPLSLDLSDRARWQRAALSMAGTAWSSLR